VLVNATKTTAGAPSSASAADCSAATGEAYELTGSREPELAKFVGRRVEITGMLKEARTTTAPDGGQKPTGGFDPLKQDLKLFEVNVTSFREVTAQSAAASPAPPAQVAPPSQQAAPPAQPAAPPAEPAAPAAQPAAPAAPPAPAARPAPPAPPEAVPGPRQELPRTASSLPLLGLMGALSLAAGIALRRLE
jgi:hypothetical protein